MDGRRRNDVYNFNFLTKIWKKLKTVGEHPDRITRHASCIYKENLYIFGGFAGPHIENRDLYVLNLETLEWRVIKTDVKPSSRFGHCFLYSSNHLFLLGGCTKVQGSWFFCEDGYYEFNLASNKWNTISNAFQKTTIAGHCAIQRGNTIIIFGGFDQTHTRSNECIEYNVVTQRWMKYNIVGELPPKTSYSSAVLYKDKIYIFGGSNGRATYENDLFILRLPDSCFNMEAVEKSMCFYDVILNFSCTHSDNF